MGLIFLGFVVFIFGVFVYFWGFFRFFFCREIIRDLVIKKREVKGFLSGERGFWRVGKVFLIL